jgi:hypothetical protein
VLEAPVVLVAAVVLEAPVVLEEPVVPAVLSSAVWLARSAKYWKGLKLRLLALLMLDTIKTPYSGIVRTAHCPESNKNPSKF